MDAEPGCDFGSYRIVRQVAIVGGAKGRSGVGR
jgi:hypothetical protein